jgi:hypothetical protein
MKGGAPDACHDLNKQSTNFHSNVINIYRFQRGVHFFMGLFFPPAFIHLFFAENIIFPIRFEFSVSRSEACLFFAPNDYFPIRVQFSDSLSEAKV